MSIPRVLYCRAHNFNEIDSTQLYVLFCFYRHIRQFLFTNCIPRVGDRIFITFSSYNIFDKPFRIRVFIFYFFYGCISLLVYLRVFINHSY